MTGRLLQTLGILGQFVRIGVIRKSQFRVEFINQVVMDVTFYATHVLLFELVYGMVDELAGWRIEDVRVLLAFYFVSDAFMMVWLGQAWHFGDDLKKGNLDPYRVRPASPVLLYFLQRFSLEGCANFLIAAGYLGYALAVHGVEDPLWTAVAVPWGVALAAWARAVLSIGFSIFELYVLNSDLGRLCYEVFDAASDKPLEIFTRRVQQFFLFCVPVGVLAWIPAGMVTGRVGPLEAALHTGWMLLFGLGVFRLWRHGFHRYESAMS